MKPKRRIPAVSPAMAAKKRQYSKLRAQFLKDHLWCQVWLRENGVNEPDVMPDGRAWKGGYGGISYVVGIAPRSEDVHHVRGRGTFLLDTSTWLAVSRFMHEKIHACPCWATSKGYISPDRNRRPLALPPPAEHRIK